jgi:hypothetical protein
MMSCLLVSIAAFWIAHSMRQADIQQVVPAVREAREMEAEELATSPLEGMGGALAASPDRDESVLNRQTATAYLRELRLLESEGRLTPRDSPIRSLIELMRRDDQIIPFLQAALESEQGPVARANLLYCLYAATGEVAWLDRLITMAKTEVVPEYFWHVFVFGQWDERDLPLIWNTLGDIVLSRGLDQENWAITLVFYDMIRGGMRLIDDRGKVRRLTELFSGHALDRSLDIGFRVNSLHALVGIDRGRFLVTAAQILGKQEEPLRLRESAFRDAKLVGEILDVADLPTTEDARDWEAWIEKSRAGEVWNELVP